MIERLRLLDGGMVAETIERLGLSEWRHRLKVSHFLGRGHNWLPLVA